MPSKTVKTEALNTLDGVTTIAKNEMLVQGQYNTSVVDLELKNEGAVCGGRRACLVGSLYLANGRNRISRVTSLLMGVEPAQRKRFMANKPGLKLAYDALNEAAEKRLKRLVGTLDEYDREDLEHSIALCGPGEAYFESPLVLSTDDHGEVDRKKVISLVRSAKKIVEAA